jgi:crotonobetainyl-CoA:carnitine CoA-transferase CaiB-like acyl-CoA transferase
LLLAVGSDRQFQSLLAELGVGPNDPTWLPLATNAERVKNRKQLVAGLGSLISRRTAEELVVGLRKRNVPAGLIRPIAEALEDKSVVPLRLVAEGLSGLRGFVAFGVGQKDNLSAPPHLGEHNKEILHFD